MTDVAPQGLYTPEEIYRLLPAVYRVRDQENDGALHQLLEVICDQVNAVAESLEQLYDDQFIETCSDWAAPYIGDLIGYRTLHGVVPKVASPRAEVANTIRYRRRKGTASMLEQLARDVTGWPARAVEFFELLATTQYMNHPRPHAAATTDLRDAGRLATGGPFQAGAFESSSYTAEMRRISGGGGRYNIRNVGIFLWRAQAVRVTQSPLAEADASGRRYRFDPLGADAQLFGDPRPEEEITHLAEPFDVPLPLTVRWVRAHLIDYYGPGRSILLEEEPSAGAGPEPVTAVDVCDLSDDPGNPGSWRNEPGAGDPVVVDPRLGRVAYPAAAPAGATRLATFHRGSALAIGGGGYDRSADIEPVGSVVTAAGGQSLAPLLGTVDDGGAVEIVDTRRYVVPATITIKHQLDPDKDGATTLRATNRMRPHLSRADHVRLDIEADATVVLDGLLLAGAPLVIDESDDAAPRHLVIRHCTLVPGLDRTPAGEPQAVGRASVIVLHPFATVTIDKCVVGPVVMVNGSECTISDSVIDASGRAEVAYCGRPEVVGGALRTVTSAPDRETGNGLAAGGHLTMDACTVIGRVHAEHMDVSNSIVLADDTGAADPWPAPLWAERRQIGCVRFSFVPAAARTPRRFQCVPRAGVDPGAVPHHTSLRFGDPGYGQLRRATPRAIRVGSDDESEMGVTHGLYQPQREANLGIRLEEYLRFGLEAGLFYAT